MLTSTTIALIALSQSTASPSVVSEYFPMNPGDEWTYEERSEGRGQTSEDSVGSAVPINGIPAFPISTRLDGRPSGVAYHAFVGDSVMIVAFDIKKPLEPPYPILKCDANRRGTWEYTGTTSFMGEFANLSLKGSTKPGPTMDVLGTKRETIEVTLDAVVSVPELPKAGVKNQQIAIYAKGIGLVELRETSQVSNRREERTRKLISYKPKGK